MPDAASVLIGPGRDGVDADVLRTEIGGQVAHRRFERRLRHAHHVVVGEHALAAEIRQRQDAAAAAPLHQRRDAARQRDERVGADVERDAETRRARSGRTDSTAPSRGANAAPCTRKSRPPNSSSIVANSVAICSSLGDVARQHERLARASPPARGRFPRAARPGYVSASRAPAPRAACAMAQEIDRLLATPTMRPCFPERSDMDIVER